MRAYGYSFLVVDTRFSLNLKSFSNSAGWPGWFVRLDGVTARRYRQAEYGQRRVGEYALPTQRHLDLNSFG